MFFNLWIFQIALNLTGASSHSHESHGMGLNPLNLSYSKILRENYLKCKETLTNWIEVDRINQSCLIKHNEYVFGDASSLKRNYREYLDSVKDQLDEIKNEKGNSIKKLEAKEKACVFISETIKDSLTNLKEKIKEKKASFDNAIAVSIRKYSQELRQRCYCLEKHSLSETEEMLFRFFKDINCNDFSLEGTQINFKKHIQLGIEPGEAHIYYMNELSDYAIKRIVKVENNIGPNSEKIDKLNIKIDLNKINGNPNKAEETKEALKSSKGMSFSDYFAGKELFNINERNNINISNSQCSSPSMRHQRNMISSKFRFSSRNSSSPGSSNILGNTSSQGKSKLCSNLSQSYKPSSKLFEGVKDPINAFSLLFNEALYLNPLLLSNLQIDQKLEALDETIKSQNLIGFGELFLSQPSSKFEKFWETFQSRYIIGFPDKEMSILSSKIAKLIEYYNEISNFHMRITSSLDSAINEIKNVAKTQRSLIINQSKDIQGAFNLGFLDCEPIKFEENINFDVFDHYLSKTERELVFKDKTYLFKELDFLFNSYHFKELKIKMIYHLKSLSLKFSREELESYCLILPEYNLLAELFNSKILMKIESESKIESIMNVLNDHQKCFE